MATPNQQARAMLLLARRWQCHAEGRREELDRAALPEHATEWERWQRCLAELARVLEGYQRA